MNGPPPPPPLQVNNILRAYVNSITMTINERELFVNELRRILTAHCGRPGAAFGGSGEEGSSGGLPSCTLCCDSTIDACFSCGHTLCVSCAEKIVQEAVATCPMCRTNVKAFDNGHPFLKLFM